jgi:AcrR family transcriptional regulator
LGIRTDRTADTRERIERAALKCFVEQGVAETSIRDIAAEAGISLGAMYNHFVSKDELAWQVFIAGWKNIAQELGHRASGKADLEFKLNGAIDCLFTRFDQDPLLVTYIFNSRHRHFARIGAARGDPYMVLRMIIADAMRRGEIPRGDLDLKTAIVAGAAIQTIDSRILGRVKGRLADQVATTAALCLRVLGWAPAAGEKSG